jgi:hypothetical protein
LCFTATIGRLQPFAQHLFFIDYTLVIVRVGEYTMQLTNNQQGYISMRYRAYSKKSVAEAKKGDVFLRLTNQKGDVLLSVVDKEGKTLDRHNILILDSDNKGVIFLTNVADDAPFKLDFTNAVLHTTDGEFSKIGRAMHETHCRSHHGDELPKGLRDALKEVFSK